MITFVSEKTSEFSEYSIAINRLYAKLWNISFFCFDEATQHGVYDMEKRDRRWNKVGILRKLLAVEGSSASDEYFIWFDADMIVLNFTEFDLYSIIGQHRAADFIVSSEWHAESGVANTGCFIVKRSGFSRYLVEQWWKRYDRRLGHDQTFFSVLYKDLVRASAVCGGDRLANGESSIDAQLDPDFDCSIIGRSASRRFAIIPMTTLNSHPMPALNQQPRDCVLHLMGESDRVRAEAFRAAVGEIRHHLHHGLGVDLERTSTHSFLSSLRPQLGLDRRSLYRIVNNVLEIQRLEFMQDLKNFSNIGFSEANSGNMSAVLSYSKLALEAAIATREVILQLTSYNDHIGNRSLESVFLESLREIYRLLRQAVDNQERYVRRECLSSGTICIEFDKHLQRCEHSCIVIGNDILAQMSVTVGSHLEDMAPLLGEILSMLLRLRQNDASGASGSGPKTLSVRSDHALHLDGMISQHLGNMAAFQITRNRMEPVDRGIGATASDGRTHIFYPSTSLGIVGTLLSAVETQLFGAGTAGGAVFGVSGGVDQIFDRLARAQLELLKVVACFESSLSGSCGIPSFQLVVPVAALAERLMDLHMRGEFPATGSDRLWRNESHDCCCVHENGRGGSTGGNTGASACGEGGTLTRHSLLLFDALRRYQEAILAHELHPKQDHLQFANTLIRNCRNALSILNMELVTFGGKFDQEASTAIRVANAVDLTRYLTKSFGSLRSLHRFVDSHSSWCQQYQRVYGVVFEDEYFNLEGSVDTAIAHAQTIAASAAVDDWPVLHTNLLRQQIESNISHIFESVRALTLPGKFPGGSVVLDGLLRRGQCTSLAVFSYLHRVLLQLVHPKLHPQALKGELESYVTSFVALYSFYEPLLELVDSVCKEVDVELRTWSYEVLFTIAQSQQKLLQIQQRAQLPTTRHMNELTVKLHSKLLIGSALCYYTSVVEMTSSYEASVSPSRHVDDSRVVSVAETLMNWISEQVGLMNSLVAAHGEVLAGDRVSYGTTLNGLQDRLQFNLCPGIKHLSESLFIICGGLTAV